MLEHLPEVVGHTIEGIRAGADKAVFNAPEFSSAPATIQVTSAAFQNGGTLDKRFTDDGTGVSPPLSWSQIPPETGALVLIIEDVDSPTPQPLVHTIAWNLPGQDGGLPEAGLPSKTTPANGVAMGRNSFLQAQYLAPDPPPGHGPHHYYFQLFAVQNPLELMGDPELHTVVNAMAGHVTARGLLIGVYERK